MEIDFDNPVIGRSRRAMDLSPASYRREVADARTFGMMKDVERYWKAGFALGASLENTVAVGETGVVNPEGLRFPDEFVRHKILDAVGDLALAGLPIQGAYRSYCGGHRMNVGVLSASSPTGPTTRSSRPPARGSKAPWSNSVRAWARRLRRRPLNSRSRIVPAGPALPPRGMSRAREMGAWQGCWGRVARGVTLRVLRAKPHHRRFRARIARHGFNRP